jgi:glycosyltransferase involved in cell wall biosynthesis
MRIALYSPYLPKHLGGGEKYLLDVAQVLIKAGHEVILGISSLEPISISQKTQLLLLWSNFSGHDLTQLKIQPCPLNTSASWWRKLIWTSRFDRLYYQTDGSLFFSLAKKNILHIQIPFTQPKNSLIDRLKLSNWTIKNTNSEFTKSVIEKTWQTKIDFVHTPMIQPVVTSVSELNLLEKKPIILHVGRFFKQLHCKHQEILVKAFSQLIHDQPELMKSWELVCLGSIEDQAYADEVHELAKNLPIKFVHKATREVLNQYYKTAKIYWHATGFGEDETVHPERMEHFGISTVEAMSAGVAPVVINKGGQKEITSPDLTEWTWETEVDLKTKTLKLIQFPQLLAKIQLLAYQKSLQFNQAGFSKTLAKMIE